MRIEAVRKIQRSRYDGTALTCLKTHDTITALRLVLNRSTTMNPDEPNLPGVEFVDAVVGIVNSLPTRERDELMTATAINYSALGLLDDAIKSADEISDSYLRDTALTQIAVNTIAHEPDADVLSLVESIDDPGNQNLALEEIAAKYAEQKLFDQALEVCERLDDCDSALARIASITGKGDSLERSEELIQQINDGNTRSTCLIELATIARSSGQLEEAEKFLMAAEAEIENQSVHDRVYRLIAIADVYEELNQRENAKEILLRAFQLCDEIRETGLTDLGNTWDRDEVMVHLTGAFARCREFDQAELATQQIENPIELARASTQHAIEQHKEGHETQALQMLSEARNLIASETVYSDRLLSVRDQAFEELAFAYKTLQDFKNGLSATLLISNPAHQFMDMIELGKHAAQAGLIESVFEIEGALIHDYARASYLISVSDALLKSDHKELAARLLLRAIEHANKLQRTDQRCLALIRISFGLTACDLEAKANELLSEVLNATIKTEDSHQQAQLLVALAEQYRQHARSVSQGEKQLLEELPT